MSMLKVGRPSTNKKQKAIEEVQELKKEEVVKMNINIERSFYKKIKQKALDEDTTVTELVTRIVKEYISK
jgi:hypothetical protein